MTPPIIQSISFQDISGLPEVHSDNRRTMYEKITKTKDDIVRISRSLITADEAILGNHYHDFNQQMSGQGEGVLYTAPKDNPAAITEQPLPEGGWQFVIPAGMVMALRLKQGAVLIFESNKEYRDGANTHRVVIV